MALQPHAQTMAASALEQGVQRESGMDQAAVAARTPATAHALAPAAAARREPATRPDAATQAAIAAERGYLLRMALRQLRDRMLAEDVVHDTLLAALQGAGAYAARSSLRTWLTGILHHRIADALRRHYRVREVNVEPATADGWNPHNLEQAASADELDHRDPSQLLETRQRLQALTQGLQRLSPIAAQVLLLRQLEGCSNDETATRLQLDPSQVPAILHRARSRLGRLALEPAPARPPRGPRGGRCPMSSEIGAATQGMSSAGPANDSRVCALRAP